MTCAGTGGALHSFEYFCFVVAPSSQGREPPTKLGRFTSLLASSLSEEGTPFEDDAFGADLLRLLTLGAFVHPPGEDQVAITKKRYAKARNVTPAVVTITTTMDCNLGCYYCYEDRSGDALATSDVDAVVSRIDRVISDRDLSSLHVDWYGGEPLLNQDFIERASFAIQRLCRSKGVDYIASVISNGTEWPEDAVGFIERNAIRQVQISFDGLADNHDRRRRYRKGYGTQGASSFAKAVDLVGRLVSCARVDLRFNIDRRNQGDLLPFISFAEAQGWFSAPFPAVFQPARLASYSQSSAFMRGYELTLEEFDALRGIVRDRLRSVAIVEESEVPDGFPHPRTSVCAALSANAFVVGADRLIYRCGLQVGEKNRAIDAVDDQGGGFPDVGWWNTFDPTELPTCGVCSFLPICWGGCPKRHLERDAHALHEQSVYWRSNLPRLIAERAGFHNFYPLAFSEREQFRIGLPASRSRRIDIVLVQDAEGGHLDASHGDLI